MLKAIKMVTKRFEITVVDPISNAELDWFECMVLSSDIALENDQPIEMSLTSNGRILMVEGLEDIYQLISLMAEHEFIHDIGLIKEVIDYEPIYEDEQLITIEFDND